MNSEAYCSPRQWIFIFEKEFTVLVLSRKKNESIVINGNIVITITEISNGKCRIGIEAPEDVKVMRKELVEDGK